MNVLAGDQYGLFTRVRCGLSTRHCVHSDMPAGRHNTNLGQRGWGYVAVSHN
jgi:hypothetical protein